MELKYTCRYCGRTAIIGKHRCFRERIAKLGRRTARRDPDQDLRDDYVGEERSPTRYPWRQILLTSAIAALVVLSFVYAVAGQLGIVLILVVPIALLIARGVAAGILPSRAEYRRLLSVCHGDEALAERLIAAEMRRDPALTRPAAIREARRKLETDRR
jgi:hypothetical protein